MTKDDIIKMAADAGFEISKFGMPIVRHSSGAWVGVADRIENFYNLAVAHEQNRCIGIIYGQCGSDNVAQRTVDAIRSQS